MKRYLILLMLLSVSIIYAQDIVSIAEIQNNLDDYVGQDVVIQGVVTIGDDLLYPTKTQFYVQDESGRGIQIFNHSALSTIYIKGDKVEISGEVDLYDGGDGDNYDVQISDPAVTLISQGNAMPAAYVITGGEALDLNGTWSRAIGVITDIWDSPYGFYQIAIDVGGAAYDLQFWDSTGADVSDYEEDDLISAYGVIAFYQGTPQLTCAYASDISLFTGNLDSIVENIIYDDSSADSIEVSFSISQAEGGVEKIEVNYNLDYDNKMHVLDITETGSDPVIYTVSAPAQDSGVTVNFNLYIEFSDAHFVQELAFASYTYPVITHKAILKVPATPFDPIVNSSIPIDFYSQAGDKAILRIINSEGKLVYTPVNGIITSSSGANTYNWDGRDRYGNICPIGLYFVHLQVIKAGGGKTKTNTVPIVIGTPLK